MTRKCHNYIRQTNPWHNQEDPKNTSDTKFRTHQSTKLYLPQRDETKTRKEKLTVKQNKHLTINPYKQWEQKQTMNKQKLNNCLRTNYRRSP